MRAIIGTVLLLALAVCSLGAMPPTGKGITADQSLVEDNGTYIDANSILMFVTNHGGFGRDLEDLFGYDAGTFFPFTSVSAIESGSNITTCLYAAGLWVGGYVDGELRVALSEYDDEFVPGPMSGGTFQPDSPEFKLYKINSTGPNLDWYNWPYLQGAPWKYDDDGMTRIPDLLGDQMLWSVYNDANPDQHDLNSGSTDPLGIEVRHSTWAYDADGPLRNVIFYRYRIFNKGGNRIENCYLSLWVDPDIGQSNDDLVGCDTLRTLGYAYNATNSDSQYGSTPPSIGFRLLQGPVVETGNDEDTARMWGGKWPGKKNMGMTTFTKYIGGTDPDDSLETYNYMRGLDRNGDPYLYNGEPTQFICSGDPVAMTGDLDANPADRRFMVTTGPITFAAGDSTELYAAIVVGQGTDRLSSIVDMRLSATMAKDVYYLITDPDIPTDVDEPGDHLPNDFSLAQNYPNPFNPSTNITYSLPQGANVTLTVYNIIGQQVKSLVDRFQPAGEYNVSWEAVDEQGEEVASGVYFYRLTVGDKEAARSMILVR